MVTKQQADQLLGFDLGKLFGAVPGMDVEAIIASQRRNWEAMNEANQVAYTGYQAALKRQFELMQENFKDATDGAKHLGAPGTAQEKAVDQLAKMKDVVERSFANLAEVSDMIAGSNRQACELLNKRFVQGMDEFASLLGQSVRK